MKDARSLRITESELQQRLGEDDVRVIDARPPAQYGAGHIAGAVNFDPFPPYATTDTSPAGMQAFVTMMSEVFGRLGIAPTTRAVCYDEVSGVRASRLVWLLHAFGHPDAVLLDGGIGAWQAAGLPLDHDEPTVAATTFAAQFNEAEVAGFQDVLERLSNPDVVIWDVRSDAEYYAEKVRATRGGAIPGAIHHEWTNNLAEYGSFKDLETLRTELEALGITPDREIIPY